MMKCRAYLHEKLDTSKGVIWSRELALATEEEIASALGKHKEWIQTNSYILTLNQPHTPKEVKICYFLESWAVRPSILRFFKSQKYWHLRVASRRWHTCAKCGEKDLDHMEEDSLMESICVNCRQDHLAYTRSCNVYKKEKEIFEEKYKRNVSSLEAKKMVGPYMGENSYASVAQKVDALNQDKK